MIQKVKEDVEVFLSSATGKISLVKKGTGREKVKKDVEVLLSSATGKHCLLPLAGRGGEEGLGVSSKIQI